MSVETTQAESSLSQQERETWSDFVERVGVKLVPGKIAPDTGLLGAVYHEFPPDVQLELRRAFNTHTHRRQASRIAGRLVITPLM